MGTLFLTKGARTYNRAKAVLSAHDNEITGHCMQKKKNLDKEPIFFTKINSKRTIDLNVKHSNIKLLQNNTGENLYDLGLGKHKMTSKAQVIKRKN